MARTAAEIFADFAEIAAKSVLTREDMYRYSDLRIESFSVCRDAESKARVAEIDQEMGDSAPYKAYRAEQEAAAAAEKQAKEQEALEARTARQARGVVDVRTIRTSDGRVTVKAEGELIALRLAPKSFEPYCTYRSDDWAVCDYEVPTAVLEAALEAAARPVAEPVVVVHCYVCGTPLTADLAMSGDFGTVCPNHYGEGA